MQNGSKSSREFSIELFLSLAVIVVVIVGALLVTPASIKPSQIPVSINTLTASQYASDLLISRSQADEMIHLRNKQDGFFSVGNLLETGMKHRFFNTVQARALRPLLTVRSVDEVLKNWVLLLSLLLLIYLFYGPWLRKRAKVSGDPFLLPVMFFICGLSILLLFTLRDPLRDTPLVYHQAIGMALGLVLFTFCSRIKPELRREMRRYPYVWGVGALVLFLSLCLVGHGPGGVRLELAGFQPIEIAKILLVLFAASYLSEHAEHLADSPTDKTRTRILRELGPLVILFSLSLLLFFLVKDLGPGLLLFMVLVSMLTLTTGRWTYSLIGVVMVALGGWIGYLLHIGVYPVRVDMWLHPFHNSHSLGMQLAQGLWGMSSGGWSGSGLGLGMSSLIPRCQDDFIFASWAEQTGWFGAILLLCLFSALIWRGMKIGDRAQTSFDRALAYGISCLFGVQILLILGGVTGLLPLTGLSLPFIAYGDSALMLDFIAVGLLRSISATPGIPAPVSPPIMRASAVYRYIFLGLIVGVVGIVRMGQVQLLESQHYATELAYVPDADAVIRPHVNPRLLSIANTIVRGTIYDRNNIPIATSTAAEILKLAPNNRVTQKLLLEHGRYYPLGEDGAQLIGIANNVAGGPSGIEAEYDEQLRGYSKLGNLLSDYRNRWMPWYKPPQGENLHTSLDSQDEKLAWNALQEILAKKSVSKGAFVVVSPASGDILASVSAPSFHPNQMNFATYKSLESNPDNPMLDRVTEGYYPPGSTLKVATVAAALDTWPDALNFQVACNHSGVVKWSSDGKIYSRVLHDDLHDPSFGTIRLRKAFTVSSNIYFGTLAAKLGPDVLRNALILDGFSKVPTVADFGPDIADIGYGQGLMLASPMEMVQLLAAVGNGGTLMKPRIGESTSFNDSNEHVQKYPATVSAHIMTSQTAATLRGLLRDVVLRGTAQGLFMNIGMNVGGKTGTAQVGRGKQPDSWFLGVAPCPTTPQYAFACVLEHAGYGRDGAGLVCQTFLKHLSTTK